MDKNEIGLLVSCLMLAAKENLAELARSLIKIPKVSACARGRYGETPLHWAAMCGCMEMAELLLEAGAKVNSRSVAGFTPLHAAAMSGRMKMAKLLLEAGAKVNSKDRNGLTPLDLARKSGRTKTVKLLEKYAKKPKTKK